ncbi:hypothetical protein HY501_03115 [Candidatus Woesearchaeota archaeon]|nr:hypothetical protein [Candidatus Woesearchaeota archaeon]
MRTIKPFEEFIRDGTARKINIDRERAKSLVLEAERKFKSLEETIKKMGVSDANANDYIEYCYNIAMFLVRARMFGTGYASSGQGAHEAEVSFARKLGFNEAQVQFLDQLRYFRNGILYYGKRFDREYAEKVIDFTRKTYGKLRP